MARGRITLSIAHGQRLSITLAGKSFHEIETAELDGVRLFTPFQIGLSAP